MHGMTTTECAQEPLPKDVGRRYGGWLSSTRAGLAVYHADALELCASLDAASVDLVLCDPPYFRVKDEPWDRQWDTPQEFLAWIGQLCEAFRRVLKPNGSLYLFASPDMAGRVEGEVRERFNVLNHLVWEKPEPSKAATYGEERLRAFIAKSERVIFAEQQNGEEMAANASDYWTQREALKQRLFGDYILAEMERAGVTRKQVAALFPSATGGMTGCVSNWLLGLNCPTTEQYQTIRDYLNSINCRSDYLRREYEDLRREYEDLRREYEDLRRPFAADEYCQYEDVWHFATVPPYPGKHPCEKPLSLLQHIVRVSSRSDAVVLDPCCGSGATGEAALSLGRQAILGDASAHWAQYAAARLSREFGAMPVGSGRARPARRKQPNLTLDLETD